MSLQLLQVCSLSWSMSSLMLRGVFVCLSHDHDDVVVCCCLTCNYDHASFNPFITTLLSLGNRLRNVRSTSKSGQHWISGVLIFLLSTTCHSLFSTGSDCLWLLLVLVACIIVLVLFFPFLLLLTIGENMITALNIVLPASPAYFPYGLRCEYFSLFSFFLFLLWIFI